MQFDLGMRLIVSNPESGERYTQASSEEWSTTLEAWKVDMQARNTRLEPILRRAAKRGTWTLYNAAKRAAYKRYLPCPMPWDHVIFSKDSSFLRER